MFSLGDSYVHAAIKSGKSFQSHQWMCADGAAVLCEGSLAVTAVQQSPSLVLTCDILTGCMSSTNIMWLSQSTQLQDHRIGAIADYYLLRALGVIRQGFVYE